MNEERIFRQLFEKIGLGSLFEPNKMDGPNQARYKTVDDKPITTKGLIQHEIVKDLYTSPTYSSSDAMEVPSPSRDPMHGYPILPTPIGNIVETAAGATGQVNPMLGILTGIAAGRWQGGLRNNPSPIYPYKNFNMPTYGKYTKVSDNIIPGSMQNLVNQWGQRQAALNLQNIKNALNQVEGNIPAGISSLTNRVPYFNQATREIENISPERFRELLLEVGEGSPILSGNKLEPGFGRFRDEFKSGYKTQYAY